MLKIIYHFTPYVDILIKSYNGHVHKEEKKMSQHHFKRNDRVSFATFQNSMNGKQVSKIMNCRVLKFLASGSQADLYVVYDEKTNNQYVMKHLYGEYATEKELYYNKCMFLTMIDQNQLHKDLILPLGITPSITDKGSFCYLMEYVQGFSSVAKIISYGMNPNYPHDHSNSKNSPKLSNELKAELIYKVADIMDCLHTNGFVYGDLSGYNVMYKIESNHVKVKIVDADNLIPKGFNLGLSGTGLYRAPEILTGKSFPTIHSDLYALAVLAFRVFFAAHPLDGDVTRSVSFSDDNIAKYYGEKATFAITDRINSAPRSLIYDFMQSNAIIQNYFYLAFHSSSLHSLPPKDGENEKRPSARLLMQCLQAAYPQIR